MIHRYRGFRYEIRVLSRYVMFRVFKAGMKNRLRWLKFKKAEFADSGDYKANPDECEEEFIVRVHQAAHSFIDEAAEKRDYTKNLRRIANDTGVEFLSRISK